MRTSIKIVCQHLEEIDPTMAELVSTFATTNVPQERQSEEYFGRLCDDILSQQLSLKAAATIGKRFTDFFEVAQPGELLPQRVNRATHAELRALGLPNAKANYVLGLAEAVVQKKLNFEAFSSYTDEEVITNLTAIKGIGRWTAEMFLIFTMGRENVFSWGDLGLKKGLPLLYGAAYTEQLAHAQARVEQWSPYKSYASLALWRWQDQGTITAV